LFVVRSPLLLVGLSVADLGCPRLAHPLSFRASYVLGFLIELLTFLPGIRHLQTNLSLSPPNPPSLQGRGLG